MRSIDALTSLRFFAALYVLVFHSGSAYMVTTVPALRPLATFFGNGYLGVPFFFVLSGFVLALSYDGKLKNTTDLGRYTVARVARIYPVYLLAMLMLLPVIVQTGTWRSLAQFVLLQFWLPLWQLGAWDNTNFPAWSLSVELAFYVIFPAVLALLCRLQAAGIAWTAAALGAAMLALRLPSLGPGIASPVEALQMAPFPLLRAPEFALGACLGLLHNRRPHWFSSAWIAPTAGGATIVLLATWSSVWLPAAVTLFFAAIIAGIASNQQSTMARVLGSPLLVEAGAASYALYILQMPVRYWLGELFPGSMAARALYAPGLVVLSFIVYRHFEEPMRELLRGRRMPSVPVRSPVRP